MENDTNRNHSELDAAVECNTACSNANSNCLSSPTKWDSRSKFSTQQLMYLNLIKHCLLLRKCEADGTANRVCHRMVALFFVDPNAYKERRLMMQEALFPELMTCLLLRSWMQKLIFKITSSAHSRQQRRLFFYHPQPTSKLQLTAVHFSQHQCCRDVGTTHVDTWKLAHVSAVTCFNLRPRAFQKTRMLRLPNVCRQKTISLSNNRKKQRAKASHTNKRM